MAAVLVGWMSASASLWGDEPVDDQASPALPPLAHVIRAGSMIGTELQSADHDLGTVSDYVLDLKTGHVALILTVRQDASEGTSQRAAVPMTSVSWKEGVWRLNEDATDRALAAARRFARESTRGPIHRVAVGELMLAFGDKPFWNRVRDDTYGARDKMPRWHTLRGRKIRDRLGAYAGEIEDFAIAADTGQIAYAAIDTRATGIERRFLYSVPLPAFLVPDTGEAWRIELSQKDLREMPRFPHDKWPGKISPRWIEYVHVRYGNSVLGGVQVGKSKAEGADGERPR